MAETVDLRAIAPTISIVLGVPAPRGAEAAPIDEVVDTLRSADRLALVVVDGFGSSLWAYVRGNVPLLNRVAALRHREIRSVLPSMTYICISTMLTGVSPSSHGVTDLNTMIRATRSPRMDSVFNRVRDAGGQTMMAVHERDVAGLDIERFADRTVLAKERNDLEIYARVPGLIFEHSPAFAFVHLLDVDEAGHRYGPYSPEVRQAASGMDRNLKGLLAVLATSGYGVVIVADHGMHESPERATDEGGNRGTHDGSVPEDLVVPLLWATAEELRDVTKGI
ncbi:MAG: alkaline phosphatase family protein [Gemmatimonadota bacterium]|nr:alkaline phosphatase family protein [Gemmatimonadota bacterium]